MGKVTVEHLSFGYAKENPIIENCSLTSSPDEIIALVGPSGEGKTTLLKLIASILSPSEGKINYDGTLSYMPQEDLLLPFRTAYENVLLPFELNPKTCRKEAEEEALYFLEKLEILHEKNSMLSQLSGGVKRRYALARALMQSPDVLLLDEPFSSIDIYLREQLFPFLRAFVSQKKRTLIFVTHDFRDAALFADRILFFADKKIQKEWTAASIPSHDREKQLLDALRAIHKNKVYV